MPKRISTYTLLNRAVFLLLCCFVYTSVVEAQDPPKKIKILGAKRLKRTSTPQGPVRKLTDDVRFKQGDMLMSCDSAILYEETNILKAYGNVRINKGDSLFLEGDSLDYNGDSKMAKLRGHIRLEDASQILVTNYLDYDMNRELAYYLGGGTITSKEDQSSITSESGYYFTEIDRFEFEGEVQTDAPDYTIESDTMNYNAALQRYDFHGPTTIVTDSTTIYAESGWADQKNDLASFSHNVHVTDRDLVLKGDSVFLNQKTGFGQLFGNAYIEDTLNKVIITGEYAWYNQTDSTSFVTDSAQMRQIMDGDTMYLHGDTLITQNDSTGKILLAFHHVKLFKNDIQAKCDSLVYARGINKISLFSDPVLWSDSNQITGIQLDLFLEDGGIDSMLIMDKAFITSRFDSAHFNQVKGRSLIAYFKQNELKRIFINGNGESIYFIDEEDGTLVGANKLQCSDYRIDVDSNKVTGIHAYTSPAATFYPPIEFSQEIVFFGDFVWLDALRPKSPEAIFIWPYFERGA
jgi:lipopolysaccharide assembly outer membrane protein LptD (OstA)